MARFADTNVSQGSVATYARYGGIFNVHLTASLPRNLPVKKVIKSVKIWQNCGNESVAPFLAHPVVYRNAWGVAANGGDMGRSPASHAPHITAAVISPQQPRQYLHSYVATSSVLYATLLCQTASLCVADQWLSDWVVVIRPTRHEIGHFGDVMRNGRCV